MATVSPTSMAFAYRALTREGQKIPGIIDAPTGEEAPHLPRAGLAGEQGLRLIAGEMSRGSIKRTLEQVAAELESGQSLPQAIERHHSQFPPLYANLEDAGIRAGSLP